MFDPVSPNVRFRDLDARWLAYWEKHRVFERSIEHRRGRKPFIFYEGPPTANGTPHAGHVLTRVAKDVFLRYRSMDGFYVPRHGGWDTHGLPVEVEVEKELGIHGRAAIEEYGIEAFTRKCIDSVFRYIDAWRDMTRKIAFWVDLDASYVTFHRSYVESIWWALKTFFEQDLLYQDYKIVWWWPQGGTALSAGEVGQGYQEVDDPSVVVRFPVKGEDNTSFLAWTTTPWTLPSNIALAVHPEVGYATAQLEDGTRVILAETLVGKLLAKTAHEIVEVRKGAQLAGAEYEPPFRYKEPEGGRAYRVITADFVTTDAGSGMVHVAPAFGEDDFRVSKENGLGFLQLVLPDGTFAPEVTDFAGRFCKEADRDIIRHLRSRGILFDEEVYRHDYPFCWRAMSDPLIQYARRSWFIRTTREIDRVIANNDQVHWEPEHIKDGRFGSFLRSNVDWALSRERFWGTPLPIWVNDETGAVEAVGSVAEIRAKNPNAFDHFEAAREADPSLSEHLIVHKPWIDAVTWTKPGEPGVYRRVPEVIDVWFDSGCMPFAQWGYPHQNKDKFEGAFPADFITEAVDQTRGWFYSLMMISNLLHQDAETPHPFRNCTVLGFVTDEKGKKLSKRDKNYKPPLALIEEHGADALRWALYTNCLPGQNTRFGETYAVDALKEFLLKLWNVYSFFVTYANIDGWDPATLRPPLAERSDLDRWICAELEATVRDTREALDGFRSHHAVRSLLALNESLSNWYLRRSRSRFWASEESADKAAAFATLYEVLVEFTKLLAPFCPFVADELFANLVRKGDGSAPASVHLTDYPKPDDSRLDEPLRAQMGAARAVVSLGQRVRTEAKIKVRQPLQTAIAVVASDDQRLSLERFIGPIAEELNVHEVAFTTEPEKYVEFSFLPNFRALGPRLGKRVPLVKKALADQDGAACYAALEERGQLEVALPDGEAVTLTREDVEIRLRAKESYAAASAEGTVVILDTRIDDTLRAEGLSREVINRLQRARKAQDLAFDARVEVHWSAEGELAGAIRAHRERIAGEILAASFLERAPTGEAEVTDIDGHTLTFTMTPR